VSGVAGVGNRVSQLPDQSGPFAASSIIELGYQRRARSAQI